MGCAGSKVSKAEKFAYDDVQEGTSATGVVSLKTGVTVDVIEQPGPKPKAMPTEEPHTDAEAMGVFHIPVLSTEEEAKPGDAGGKLAAVVSC